MLILMRSLFVAAIPAVVLFASAGSLSIVFFWAYVMVYAVAQIAMPLFASQDLIRERMQPGGENLASRYLLVTGLCVLHWMVSGIDHRFALSQVAPWLQAINLIAFAMAWATTIWAMRSNRFFSSIVRIQTDRGHTVVSSGPYRFIRHPGYAALIVVSTTSGIALSSWYAAGVGMCAVPFIVWRMINEDRELRAGLAGYKEYAANVRSALVWGIL